MDLTQNGELKMKANAGDVFCEYNKRLGKYTAC